jgi:two-component system, NarL family, nitrate/nitrite response regulator NarL
VPEAIAAIRILIVDDHALFRESVARFLDSEAGFRVVALSASVAEAARALRQHAVDIVLLDVDLGEREGARFLRTAKEEGFAGKILVVTAGVDEDEASDLIEHGVSGIFLKHKSTTLLAESIRDVMAGKVWFDQDLLRRVAARRGGPDARPHGERFSAREHAVLSGVLEGCANKEIAARLQVSESSVKATLQHLFAKTGVRTRSQLVRIVLERFPELTASVTRRSEVGGAGAVSASVSERPPHRDDRGVRGRPE